MRALNKKKMNIQNLIFRPFFIFLLSAQLALNTAPALADCPDEETWITVFVHGIMSVQPHLNWSNIVRIMSDCVENSFYSHTVHHIRTDSFFHRNQAMQDLGLQPIDKNSSYAGDASCALATLFDQVYFWTNGSHACNHHYYTYGWSGLLSAKSRLKEAKQFYIELAAEIQKFRDKGINPKVRIIGYSHGGNVLLGLAAGRQENLSPYPFHIDEAVLLGVPVQPETDFFSLDPIFKKIYHVYSPADRIQTIDLFSYGRFGSGKVFKKRRGFCPPDNLIQIELRLLRNTNSKRYFPKSLDKRYDFDNPAIVAGRSTLLRDISPGHCELWFFGWTHAHYRTHFPLSPLPIVAIMPFVLETIKQCEHLYTQHGHIVADLRPEQEVMLIRRKHCPQTTQVVTFLSQDQLEYLKDKSREFSFKRVTWSEYYEHVRAAFIKTEELLTPCCCD